MKLSEKLQQGDILRRVLQKLTHGVTSIAAYGGALLLLPLLKLIKIKKRVVFCPLPTERIGPLALNTELFLRRLKSGNHFNKNNYYLGVSHKPSNRQLFMMYKRVFSLIESEYLFQMIKTSIIRNSEFYQDALFKTREFSPNANGYYEFNDLLPVLSFTEEEEEKGKKLLAQMGIGENDWFICFHSRDSAYLNHYPLQRGRDWSYHDFRDSDVKTYLKAAEYIVAQGGFAIRVGSVVAESLPKDRHPKIIDYAVDYRSDFMDIYLAAHCNFFLGNTAGIFYCSVIFNVPVACANYIQIQDIPFTKRDLFIPKKIYSSKEGRFLTFKEILNSDVCRFWDADLYRQNNLKVVENTADEILAVTKEMYKRLMKKYNYSEEDENLQKLYRSNYQPHHFCYGASSRIGASFLRENKGLLK